MTAPSPAPEPPALPLLYRDERIAAVHKPSGLLVHRSVVESTEERAALVRQRAGLFGVMAVLGLVLAIIAPFMGSGLM